MPWENKLSVTVGMVEPVSGLKVSRVKSKGPIPRMPSTPEKPSDLDATPMDCALIVRPVPIETVSVNSVPLKSPEPYVTATLSFVWTLVLVDLNFLPAPTQVLELPVSMSKEKVEIHCIAERTRSVLSYHIVRSSVS